MRPKKIASEGEQNRSKAMNRAEKMTKIKRLVGGRMIDGYDSKNTYLVVAESADGTETKVLAVRNCQNHVRVHAYPNFRAFSLAPAQSRHRPEKGYFTSWIKPHEFFDQMYPILQAQRGLKLLDKHDINGALGLTIVSEDGGT